MGEEIIDSHCDLAVVDDAVERYRCHAVDFFGRLRKELNEEILVDEEAEDGREAFDVFEVFGADERLQLRDFILLHREEVCADPHNAVKEERHGALLLVIGAAVVPAEAQVVHERAVSVLHREVAVLRHEGHDIALVVRRSGDLRKGRLNAFDGHIAPEQIQCEFRTDHRAGKGAFEAPEDR